MITIPGTLCSVNNRATALSKASASLHLAVPSGAKSRARVSSLSYHRSIAIDGLPRGEAGTLAGGGLPAT